MVYRVDHIKTSNYQVFLFEIEKWNIMPIADIYCASAAIFIKVTDTINYYWLTLSSPESIQVGPNLISMRLFVSNKIHSYHIVRYGNRYCTSLFSIHHYSCAHCQHTSQSTFKATQLWQVNQSTACRNQFFMTYSDSCAFGNSLAFCESMHCLSYEMVPQLKNSK